MASQELIYNEKDIIAQLHDKDSNVREMAFSNIVKRFSEPLYWHIRRMVLTHDDADDILQNTFVKAWSNIENFRGDSQLSTWLYRIAINETLTFIGKQHNTISINTPEGSVAELLESDAFFNGDHAEAMFQEAVNSLPSKQRLVFVMKYFDEMKYEDISSILGTTVGALKASYHIAVKKIESYLEEKN
ncbi:MAG: RNA polymerase sigma factor [Bacteroidaceae bacterium]|nr:RNA polymerase sigma factor [Bacteroidaceae bacterium]